MKRESILVLSVLILLLVGCTSPAARPTETAIPTPEMTPATSNTLLPDDVNEQMEFLEHASVGELLACAAVVDGAPAALLFDRLSQELVADPADVLARMAAPEQDTALMDVVAFHVGTTLKLLELSAEELQPLYDAQKSTQTEREAALLKDILETYETFQ